MTDYKLVLDALMYGEVVKKRSGNMCEYWLWVNKYRNAMTYVCNVFYVEGRKGRKKSSCISLSAIHKAMKRYFEIRKK